MSIIKKAWLLKILLVALMVLLVAGMVQAAEGIKLIASEEKDLVGDKTTVTINAENAAGTEGGQFVINFNPDLVKPVEVEPGDLIVEAFSGMHMANLEYEEGQMIFMWITAAADTQNEGILCTIKFELLNEGETELQFEELTIAPEGMEPDIPIPGRITVDDSEVEQEKTEENTEIDEVERKEEVVEDEEDTNEEAAVSVTEESNNYTLIVVLIGVIILASAGFVYFKRSKKAKH